METLVGVAMGLGLSAASGMRVFLPLLALSLAVHFGRIHVGPDFAWLETNAALLTLSTAALAEVLAYFIPWLDHLLDIAAFPCAITAGVLTSSAVIHGLPPHLTWGLALVGGGGSAGLIRATASVGRVKSTLFTGGLANFVIAFLELAAAVFLCLTALFLPLFALFFLVGIAILCVIILKKVTGFWFRRRVPNMGCECGSIGSITTVKGGVPMSQLGAAELAEMMRGLDDSKKMIFQSQYNSEKKDRGTATIVALFNWDRIWFGDMGLGILKLITGGLCGIWWLIDLFTAGSRCDDYNRQKAQEIASALKVYGADNSAPAVSPAPAAVSPAAVSGSRMFCSKCGGSVDRSDAFCASCGQGIGTA